MLQLQRASAGSGKTYTLARKFIEFLISVKEEDGPRRLRSDRELRDSLPHILAITFTNKATNEMKLRIVAKLDELGSWTPDIPTKNVAYLDDFTREFNTTPQEIARICREALRILLTDYGDFKVSTIDSFFQTVLRTFAYEADLDDTYQIELDSDYVARIGLDATLDDIDSTDRKTQEQAWIDKMIRERSESGRGWNIFQKSDSKGSIYSKILEAGRNLEKEDFKVVREELDDYFSRTPDFFATYQRLNQLYEKELKETFDRMRESASRLRREFVRLKLDIKTDGGQYLGSRAINMAEKWDMYHVANGGDQASYTIPTYTRKGTQSRVFNPKSTNAPLGTPDEDRLEKIAIEMFAAFEEWRDLSQSTKLANWAQYKKGLPYLGLLQRVRDNSLRFLTDSNTVELGETNSILNRIIGDDDAPFVYERLGSRLNHFLIDEFQDTSRLQWKSLRPLVAESEGRGNDNLIIGDAKQSIYRFRNADPSLITTKVPEEFPDTCMQLGNSPAENTNWRSCRHIVEFNNLFFRHLTGTLSGDASKPFAADMEGLYFNTVQPPSHTDEKGYVRFQLCISGQDEDDIPPHFTQIPPLIADMLGRGYRQKDIAVLVDTNRDGQGIISAIMDFNSEKEEGDRINFISAESLKISESQGVQTIISVLESINKGTRAQLRPREEWNKKGIGDWSKLKADFSYYAMSHPEMTLSEQMRHFLAGEFDSNSISNMLAGMSTTVLPALTENICHQFIPDNVRNAEAPFIAAFQDKVLDFCDSYTSDIASFLLWWEKKGKYSSINSPDGTDAVQIMTVHKSKGLEFKCVIVANSKQKIKPGAFETEWLWVKPDLPEANEEDRIPWLPLETCPALANTIHRDAYNEYLKKYVTDKVNMAYVAYTRAVDELYIFAPGLSKSGKLIRKGARISEYLWDFGTGADEIIHAIGNTYPEAQRYLPCSWKFQVEEGQEEGNYVWTMGTRPSREEVVAEIEKEEEKESREKESENFVITTYRADEPVQALCIKDPSTPEGEQMEEDVDSEESGHSEEEARTQLLASEESDESRRYGELMHAIMERIRVPEDLPVALLRMKTRGFINRETAGRLNEELSRALKSVKDYRWFEPDSRILNERGIMIDGRLQRPDRVVIRRDGSVAVVDYKFGDHRNDSAYARQVKRYVSAIATAGMAKKCEAYIWYVSLGEVLRIEL